MRPSTHSSARAVARRPMSLRLLLTAAVLALCTLAPAAASAQGVVPDLPPLGGGGNGGGGNGGDGNGGDGGGNPGPPPDTSPPVIEIGFAGNLGPAPYGIDEDVRVSFSCRDPESRVECRARLSGDPLGRDVNLSNGDRVFTNPRGTRTVTVTAESRGGRDTKSASYVVIDEVAPRIVIERPTSGARYALGQNVSARFRCNEYGSGLAFCRSTALAGGRIDTTSAGPKTFTVFTADGAGNTREASVSYTVVATAGAAPVGPAGPGAGAGGGAGIGVSGSGVEEPSTGDPAVIPGTPRGDRRARPRVRNASKLKPRVAARFVSKRPTLRWKRHRRAEMYNLQIFRLDGREPVKILSVFPQRNRFKVPRGELRPGKRYIWRVWPFVGREEFTKQPLGISWFDVVTRRQLREGRGDRSGPVTTL